MPNIRLKPGALERLRVWKAKRGLTYSEAVHSLLDKVEDDGGETT